MRSSRRSIPLLPLPLLLALAACGGADASAASEALPLMDPAAAAPEPSAEPGVLGTLEARFDGRPVKFYIVAGEIRGQPYASAAWHEPAEGRLLVTVGGFDTPDPPLDTFQQGGEGGPPPSLGDYDGPLLNLVLDLPADPEPFSVSFPNDASSTTVLYLPKASVDGSEPMYFLTSGRMDVAEVARAGGRVRARGTFSGTLQGPGADGAIEVTEGRFTMEGVPSVKEITPASG